MQKTKNEERFIPTMDDIIFENREKRYGAYFLRKNQHWHEWVALALVCGMLWAGFWGWNWLKEPASKEDDDVRISRCCYCGLEDFRLSEKEYKVPILPPCPPQKVAFKIPEPVPAWKLCECDRFADPKPSKKLSPKLKKHQFNLSKELPDNSHQDDPPHVVCDCPEPVDVTFDSLLQAEVILPEPALISEPAQLINPEVIPSNIWRKIQKQKISLSIQIDPSGNYLAYRLEGKLSKRLEAQLAEAVKNLRFTPEIQAGEARSAWVKL